MFQLNSKKRQLFSRRRVVPGAEVAENLLDAVRVVKDGEDAHGALANGATERMDVPDAKDQVGTAPQSLQFWSGSVTMKLASNLPRKLSVTRPPSSLRSADISTGFACWREMAWMGALRTGSLSLP
jgi:hypothetical protein